MLFLLQQYQEVILTLLKKLFKKNLSIFISIFYPSGEPRLLGGEDWLLCCDPFAVDNHRPDLPTNYMGHASHPLMLGWGGGPRSVNNPD